MLRLFSNKRLWIITASFTALIVILFFVLAAGQRSSSNIGDGQLADVLYQREQVYIKSVMEQLALLEPLLSPQLSADDVKQISDIRAKILSLTVPSKQYLDWHWQVVRRLDLLNSVITGKNKDKNISVALLQKDLSKLVSDFAANH